MKNREAGSKETIAENLFRKRLSLDHQKIVGALMPPRKAKPPLLGDRSATRRDAALVTKGVLPAWEER
jgi:hypothetical protein